MKILELKNLSLGYSGNTVVKNTTLALEKGDFACVVGANGSGKSTLIKAILGLIKPLKGQIAFADGLDSTKIGYLPQEMATDSTFPATIEEIVLSGCLGHMGWRPFYRAHEKQHAKASMKTLGIESLAKKNFSDLSGGQKQKALLARALSATEDLLILDEPSNNLDYKARKDFYATLKRLNQDGLTIIMITHDLDADDLIGNKVIAIKEGSATVSTTADFLKEHK